MEFWLAILRGLFSLAIELWESRRPENPSYLELSFSLLYFRWCHK